jgi:DNA helicase-2/ATP-dependent DNA helicase PcrA
MTRAKQHLHLIMPARFFRTQQTRYGDGHVFSCPTRFIPDGILDNFDRTAWPESTDAVSYDQAPKHGARVDLTARQRERWQ